jgi:hypothetical protein
MEKSMIRYFPYIYTDELFFSWIARFLERMNFPIRGNVIRDLFGYTSYKAVIDFPSHLEHFLHQLSIECTHLSTDELIDWHTLLPFFAPFLPSERLKKLRKDMQGNNGLAARLRSGIMASRIPLLRELQICPKCSNSDRNKYGETYWHRSHQIPGVKVCYEHEIPLSRIKNDYFEDKFVTAEHALKQSKWSDVTILKCETHVMNTIAKDVHWLLEHPEIEAGADFVYKQYKDLLAEKGFMKKYGRKVFTNKLIKAFNNYYPSKVLTDLNCDLNDHVEKNWLVRLVQTPGNATQHPLYHLLLMRFLSQSPTEFFREKEKVEPFGKGPWPCLNPASDHFYSKVIDNCRIHLSRQNHPIGVFSCKKCGFIYSQSGKDGDTRNIAYRRRIIQFGEVWEESLIRYWRNRKNTFTAISNRLGIKEKSLLKQIKRLGLDKCRRPPLKIKTSIQQPNINILKVNLYRKKWMKCIFHAHTKSITELQNKGMKIYRWLIRHDKAWLMTHPRRQRKYFIQKGIVDWHKRDLQLSKRIRETVACIKNSSMVNKRLTPTEIFDQMGVSRSKLASMRLGKLPITKRVLLRVTNSTTPDISRCN